MVILFWFCFILTTVAMVVTLINAFEKELVRDRRISFFICCYYACVLILLSSWYLQIK